MTIILVHGNPETEAVWDDLVQFLSGRDIVRLSPPGFGSAIPAGFDCSIDAYRNWLAGALEHLEQPVDLIGHDWGGGHVARIAMERPDLIRSWTIDVAGVFDPDYVWHDLAQTWQKPKIGEQAVAQMIGAPVETRAELYQSLGMSAAVARKVAAGASEEMGRAILALYRSAIQPMMKELGSSLAKAAAKPGLVLIATEDHYCGGEMLARRSAERAGAEVAGTRRRWPLVDVRTTGKRRRRDQRLPRKAELGRSHIPRRTFNSSAARCRLPWNHSTDSLSSASSPTGAPPNSSIASRTDRHTKPAEALSPKR